MCLKKSVLGSELGGFKEKHLVFSCRVNCNGTQKSQFALAIATIIGMHGLMAGFMSLAPSFLNRFAVAFGTNPCKMYGEDLTMTD